MRQKVNPVGLRLGVNEVGTLFGMLKKRFWNNLIEDFKIRQYIKRNVVNSGVSKVMMKEQQKNVSLQFF